MNQSIYSCRIQIQIVLKHLKKVIANSIYKNAESPAIKTQPSESDNQLIINNILFKTIAVIVTYI